ncbi:MAG: DNA alkylation repair protein [Bacilli bacterium]|nr:DNA alkylation repair protein [Bacilli bacterium]
MNLIIDNWQNTDINLFQEYFLSLKNKDEKKIEWTRNIVNTNLPVLAIPSKDLKKIAKEILKGNYLSFLEITKFTYHENTIIYAYIINEIKDYNMQMKYLESYSKIVDNWASCDVLKFKIKKCEDKYLDLAKSYLKRKLCFQRRIGIIILFSLLDKDNYLDEIFKLLNSLYEEKEYYVNMAAAWLLCECAIKHRQKTYDYLENHHLNKFIINKAISKCRDSYRVSEADKNFLLKFKNVNF